MPLIRLKNKGKIIILAAATAAAFVWVAIRPAPAAQVTFLAVGQGDSALLETPGGQRILIDGGPDNSVLRRLGEKLPYGERRLDYLIVSHFHADHIIGLIAVLDRYQVGQLIYPPLSDTNEATAELFRAAAEKSTARYELSGEAVLPLGKDCGLTLISPAAVLVTDDGNDSLAAIFLCDGLSVLFTGDSSAKIEAALLNHGRDLSAAVMKAAHHGSKSANSETFLRAVRPEFLVVSAGAGNRFGHPHPEVAERAAALSIRLLRTDRDGDVSFSSRPAIAGRPP